MNSKIPSSFSSSASCDKGGHSSSEDGGRSVIDPLLVASLDVALEFSNSAFNPGWISVDSCNDEFSGYLNSLSKDSKVSPFIVIFLNTSLLTEKGDPSCLSFLLERLAQTKALDNSKFFIVVDSTMSGSDPFWEESYVTDSAKDAKLGKRCTFLYPKTTVIQIDSGTTKIPYKVCCLPYAVKMQSGERRIPSKYYRPSSTYSVSAEKISEWVSTTDANCVFFPLVNEATANAILVGLQRRYVRNPKDLELSLVVYRSYEDLLLSNLLNDRKTDYYIDPRQSVSFVRIDPYVNSPWGFVEETAQTLFD